MAAYLGPLGLSPERLEAGVEARQLPPLRLEEPLPEAVRFLVADHREQTDIFAEQRGQRTR